MNGRPHRYRYDKRLGLLSKLIAPRFSSCEGGRCDVHSRVMKSKTGITRRRFFLRSAGATLALPSAASRSVTSTSCSRPPISTKYFTPGPFQQPRRYLGAADRRCGPSVPGPTRRCDRLHRCRETSQKVLGDSEETGSITSGLPMLPRRRWMFTSGFSASHKPQIAERQPPPCSSSTTSAP